MINIDRLGLWNKINEPVNIYMFVCFNIVYFDVCCFSLIVKCTHLGLT